MIKKLSMSLSDKASGLERLGYRALYQVVFNCGSVAAIV
jgi:hypothetical protein